jgi:hypothetical protein
VRSAMRVVSDFTSALPGVLRGEHSPVDSPFSPKLPIFCEMQLNPRFRSENATLPSHFPHFGATEIQIRIKILRF